MKRWIGVAAALVALPVVLAGSASAQTTTSPVDLDVSIEIIDECVVTSPVAVNFGTVGFLSEAVTAQGSITVQCTSGVDYEIAIGAGGGDGATTSVRKMTGPGDATINYALYRDASYEQVWGDDFETDTKAGVGSGSGDVHTIYGQVPVQTTPATGVYSDTVAITVQY